jgi:hypothetical protein
MPPGFVTPCLPTKAASRRPDCPDSGSLGSDLLLGACATISGRRYLLLGSVSPLMATGDNLDPMRDEQFLDRRDDLGEGVERHWVLSGDSVRLINMLS